MPRASTRSPALRSRVVAGRVQHVHRHRTTCCPVGLGRAAAAERAVPAGRADPGVVAFGPDDRGRLGQPAMDPVRQPSSSSDAEAHRVRHVVQRRLLERPWDSCWRRRTAAGRRARPRPAGRPPRPPRRTPPAAPPAGRRRAGRAARRRRRSAPILDVLKSTIRIRPSGSRSTRSALPVSWMLSAPRSTMQENATSVPSSSNSVRACCQVTNRSRADSASTRSTADSQLASKSSWRQTESR